VALVLRALSAPPLSTASPQGSSEWTIRISSFLAQTPNNGLSTFPRKPTSKRTLRTLPFFTRPQITHSQLAAVGDDLNRRVLRTFLTPQTPQDKVNGHPPETVSTPTSCKTPPQLFPPNTFTFVSVSDALLSRSTPKVEILLYLISPNEWNSSEPRTPIETLRRCAPFLIFSPHIPLQALHTTRCRP